MSCDKKNAFAARSVVRCLSAFMVGCATLLVSPAAFAIDSGDIVVVSSKGEVHIAVNGAARVVRAGGALELPATVRTGRDGSVELRQGATTVSIGPETLLEFPALEKAGAPIDRIVQPRGNAFYSIGKREGRKLRIETRYLVGVVKGTQFNIAAQSDSTTISLFEGLLEVGASDDSGFVDLKAGEVASRRQGDHSTSVIRMDDGKARSNAPGAPASTGSNNGTADLGNLRATPPDERMDSLLPDRVAASAPVELDVGMAESVGTVIGAASPRVDAAAGADIGLGNAVDMSPPVADVATSVGVDRGSVAVDGTAGTAVESGPLVTEVSVGGAVELPSDTVDADAGVVVGASAPQVEVHVGSDLAADAIAGTVNIVLGVGGSDDIADTVGNVSETVTDTVPDSGRMLDGLLHRPTRK
jgi:hypothetical protein